MNILKFYEIRFDLYYKVVYLVQVRYKVMFGVIYVKKRNKVFIIVSIILIIVVGFVGKAFVVGEPVSGDQLKFSTFIKYEKLELKVELVDSGIALRDWKIEKNGDTINIKVRKVLVSPIYNDGSYETKIDLEGINKVILGGRTIWPIDQ